MSQHDMVLANQDFPNMRADMNAALQALASNSIGSSAPSTPYNGQTWIDNSGTPWLVKIYVEALTSWVTIGSINAAAAVGGNLLSLPIDARTSTSESILNADNGEYVTFSNTSATAVTLPQAGSSAGAVCPARWCVFVQNKNTGVVTITPTTSTINGASTLVLRKNQGALIVSDGTNYQVFFAGGDTLGLGTYTMGYSAAALTLTSTDGAVAGLAGGSTYKVNLPYVAFAASGTTHAQLVIFMPKSWDGGTITFRYWGYAASGSGNAALSLKGRAFASGDAFDGGDFGTAQESVLSTASTTAPKRSAVSSAITIANSPAGEKWICLDLYRVAATGNDTLSGIFRLTQLEINIGVDKRNDE